MTRRPAAALACCLVVLHVGCAAPALNMGRAETLRPGEVQFVAAPELSLSFSDVFPAPVAQGSMLTRLGLASWLDMGLRFWLFPNTVTPVFGGGLELRAQAIDNHRGFLHVVAALQGGYQGLRFGGAAHDMIYAALPVMLGLDVGEHQFVLSPRAGYQGLMSPGAYPVHMPTVGMGIGFVWKLFRFFEVMPEVAAVYSPVTIEKGNGTWSFQLGLGGALRGCVLGNCEAP